MFGLQMLGQYIIRSKQWPAKTSACLGLTPMKLHRPTSSCLPIYIFRLVSHLHIEISWMSGASAAPLASFPSPHPLPPARHWIRLPCIFLAVFVFKGNSENVKQDGLDPRCIMKSCHCHRTTDHYFRKLENRRPTGIQYLRGVSIAFRTFA